MNMQKFEKKETWLKRKGFYVALAVCLVAVGGASFAALNKAGGPTLEEPSAGLTQQMTLPPETTAANPVGAQATNVPDTREETTKAASKDVSMEANENNKPYESYYMYPLSENTGKKFSNGELVPSKTMGDWRVHGGVDFTGAKGNQVKAINDGIVLSVEKNDLWGYVVKIDHGNKLVASYCGLGKEVKVKKGDKIKIGEVLGLLEGVPVEAADGCLLHLEITVDGKAVNPLAAMGKEKTAASTTAPTKNS